MARANSSGYGYVIVREPTRFVGLPQDLFDRYVLSRQLAALHSTQRSRINGTPTLRIMLIERCIAVTKAALAFSFRCQQSATWTTSGKPAVAAA
jgi:hypothetical protein